MPRRPCSHCTAGQHNSAAGERRCRERAQRESDRQAEHDQRAYGGHPPPDLPAPPATTRERSVLHEPVVLRCAIKTTHTNAETGERTIALSVPRSEAARVAQLSIMDSIVFEATFRPADVQQQAELEDGL